MVVSSLIAANSIPYHADPISPETEAKLFTSRATLVFPLLFSIYFNRVQIFAPNHLCKQWQQEMEGFKPTLKVLLVTTKTQHEKCTYGDFAKADAIIVSFQFMKNAVRFSPRLDIFSNLSLVVYIACFSSKELPELFPDPLASL